MNFQHIPPEQTRLKLATAGIRCYKSFSLVSLTGNIDIAASGGTPIAGKTKGVVVKK